MCALRSSDDAFIRLKLLDKIETYVTLTIKTLTEEYKWLRLAPKNSRMSHLRKQLTRSVKLTFLMKTTASSSTKPTTMSWQLNLQPNPVHRCTKNTPTVFATRSFQSRLRLSTAPLLHVSKYRTQRLVLQCHQSPFKDKCRSKQRDPPSVKRRARSEAVFTISGSTTPYRRFGFITVDTQASNKFPSRQSISSENREQDNFAAHRTTKPPAFITYRSGCTGKSDQDSWTRGMHLEVPERLSERSVIRRQHSVQSTLSLVGLKNGDLRNHEFSSK